MLSCLWDDAYRIALVANHKESPCSFGSGFPLSLSDGPIPYVRRHITVNKMCAARR